MSAAITVITIIIMLVGAILFLPGIKPMGTSSSSTSTESVPDVNTGIDQERTVAEYQFNMACGSSLQHGCPLEDFRASYDKCVRAFGNLTVEQCQARCCKYENNNTQKKDVPEIIGDAFQQVPKI